MSGIVGAGGNLGGGRRGLHVQRAISWPTALFVLGALVSVASFLAFAVRFSPETEAEAARERAEAEEHRRQLAGRTP